MGILNVTPDSFSDGGEHLRFESAVEHGRRLLAEGADIIDVGGESTRPGAERAAVEVELARVIPVVGELVTAGATVSVDTMRSQVAAEAVAAGAALVNDVSGGLSDPDMLSTVAGLGVGYIAMHWRGHSTVMHQLTYYDDVVADVAAELGDRRDAALAAGIAPHRLILDPGLGFAKTPAHNWQILRHLEVFEALGHRILIGASRKRFLGELLADGGEPRPPKQRDDATAALTALLAVRGIWGVRTHTVAAHRDAIAVAEALRAEHRQ
ncbi:MAG: dihydropteroate synthase [Propionicimonas sp.]|nr:dihydropteroate synthase [Propionicimonas sp.]